VPFGNSTTVISADLQITAGSTGCVNEAGDPRLGLPIQKATPAKQAGLSFGIKKMPVTFNHPPEGYQCPTR
jgi:hypothetical protein